VGRSASLAQAQRTGSGDALLHDREIVLGVLIEILCFDPIATQRRVSRKRQVAFVVPLRAADRTVLPVAGKDAADRRPSPLWPLPPATVIHSLDLP
jgi:hypothetical protein